MRLSLLRLLVLCVVPVGPLIAQGTPPAVVAATADTVGYIVGAYGYGDGPDDMGKFTLTLRRARGGPWQIFSDMDNPSQPSRRPGGAPAPAAPSAP